MNANYVLVANKVSNVFFYQYLPSDYKSLKWYILFFHPYEN